MRNAGWKVAGYTEVITGALQEAGWMFFAQAPRDSVRPSAHHQARLQHASGITRADLLAPAPVLACHIRQGSLSEHLCEIYRKVPESHLIT
jgi:hypothetical protein